MISYHSSHNYFGQSPDEIGNRVKPAGKSRRSRKCDWCPSVQTVTLWKVAHVSPLERTISTEGQHTSVFPALKPLATHVSNNSDAQEGRWSFSVLLESHRGRWPDESLWFVGRLPLSWSLAYKRFHLLFSRCPKALILTTSFWFVGP